MQIFLRASLPSIFSHQLMSLAGSFFRTPRKNRWKYMPPNNNLLPHKPFPSAALPKRKWKWKLWGRRWMLFGSQYFLYYFTWISLHFHPRSFIRKEMEVKGNHIEKTKKTRMLTIPSLTISFYTFTRRGRKYWWVPAQLNGIVTFRVSVFYNDLPDHFSIRTGFCFLGSVFSFLFW